MIQHSGPHFWDLPFLDTIIPHFIPLSFSSFSSVTIPKLNAATRAQWHLHHLCLPRFLGAWVPYPGLTSPVDVGATLTGDCPVSQGTCSLPCVEVLHSRPSFPPPANCTLTMASWRLCIKHHVESLSKKRDIFFPPVLLICWVWVEAWNLYM